MPRPRIAGCYRNSQKPSDLGKSHPLTFLESLFFSSRFSSSSSCSLRAEREKEIKRWNRRVSAAQWLRSWCSTHVWGCFSAPAPPLTASGWDDWTQREKKHLIIIIIIQALVINMAVFKLPLTETSLVPNRPPQSLYQLMHWLWNPIISYVD